MRVVVAGASGFIGGRLCNYLADEGFEVIALYNKHQPSDQKWKEKMLETIQIDLSSLEQIKGLSLFNPDVIINLVSLDHIESNRAPEFVSKNNILPTWNLLQEFSKSGIQKFIYLSTIHVYGNKLEGLITENTTVMPVTPYGLTHWLSEEIVNMFARSGNIEYHNIRFSNGFGAPQFKRNNCWDIVINNLCLSAWENQTLKLKSDGSPLRDFIHLSDLLVGIKQLINQKKNNANKESIKTINFSSKNTLTMLDVAMIVKDVYEKKYNKTASVFINENEPVLSYQIRKSNKYFIDNAVFLDLMGENKLHDLEFGINEIFNFLDTSNKE